MPSVYPGWLTPLEAAKRFRLPYNRIRRMVTEGVFTRGQFSTAKGRPPMFLRVVELEAYQAGGIAAVAPVKAAYAQTMLTGA